MELGASAAYPTLDASVAASSRRPGDILAEHPMSLTTGRFFGLCVPLVEGLEARQLFAVSLPAVVQTNLTSDIAGAAAHTDANLKNAWGIVPSVDGTLWVSDNGTGVSTVYNPDGTPSPAG